MSCRAKHFQLEQHQVLHPLPYVSPWKPVDTNRELEYQQAKNKMLEEISILPSYKEQKSLRSTNIGSSQGKSAQGKKDNGVRSRTLNDFKEYFNRSQAERMRNYRENRVVLTKKDQERKKTLENMVFVRKCNPSARVRVVSLGCEVSPERVQTKVLQLNEYSRFMPISSSPPPSSPKIRPKRQNSIRSKQMAYKNISISLLSRLKQTKSPSSHQPLDAVLGKTLLSFISQQKQI